MNAYTKTPADFGVPGIYLHLLAQLLGRFGVDDNALLRSLGLDPERLLAPDARVPKTRAAEFVRHAIHVSGEPGLGLLLAAELRLPLHGPLGIAVMSSPSLGDALELGSRFLQLRLPLMRMTRDETGTTAIIRFNIDDNSPLTGFLLDAVTLGLVIMGEQLLGEPLPGVEVWRRGARPRYYGRYAADLPAPVHFNRDEDAVRFPLRCLSLPVRYSDELAARISREQCEKALMRLRNDVSVATRVCRVLETSHPFPCGLERVAAALCLSARTLKRRLQEEGTTYQTQVDRVRLQRAQSLLGSTTLSMAQIADALGYADAANFTRAFRRWMGTSPSAYRQRPFEQAL